MRIQTLIYIKKKKLKVFLLFAFFYVLLNGCQSTQLPPVVKGPPPTPVYLPFLRLEQAGECYFIDDFLPTPDSLVSGKTYNLFLRYYTYLNARYKYWANVGIMLAFYSRDLRCWALFEEYALPGKSEFK